MRPLQVGIRQRAVRLDLEGGGSAGGQVGVEGLGHFRLMDPLAAKSSCCLSLSERLPWACRSVSSPVTCSGSRWMTAVVERGVDAALALQMNAGDGDRQLIAGGPRRAAASGCASGPSRVTVPASADSPLRPCTWASLKQRADVEAREIEFGLGGVVAAESGLAVRGEFGAFKPGGQVVGDGAVGGVRHAAPSCPAVLR